jgi:ubiquitin C-terminal hydrolase
MNSGIQCLSNTPFLIDFFLLKKFKADINKKNPLGMKGKVAEVFAELMAEMHSSSSSVTPSTFKSTIGTPSSKGL